MRRLLFAGAMCTVLLCPAAIHTVHADGPAFTITSLGTYSGVVPAVSGINASGAVSATASTPGGDRAVRYTDAGGWSLIPGLESTTSYGLGINDHGDVVGYAVLSDNSIRAFRYTEGGGTEFIAPLNGGTYTQGWAISNTGEITGYGDSGYRVLAFRQSPGLLAQAIDPLGGTFSAGCGINDKGQVSGFAFTVDGDQHGFRVDVDGTTAEIPGLNGPSSANSACAIDSNGSVTGMAETAGGAQHAFLFTGGNPMDLDSFGSSGSVGSAISNGVVVGTYNLADGSTHAFRYETATGTVDLNTFLPPASGWVLTSGLAVNSKGAMAGQGLLNGAPAAWKLTPPSDTTPPTITSVSVTPSALKPDHQMVPVTVSVSAIDNVDPQPACSITSVDATEAAPGEAVITGPLTASVFSTKDSRGTIRVYTLTVTCTDSSQNSSTGSVTVEVGGNGATKGLGRTKGD